MLSNRRSIGRCLQSRVCFTPLFSSGRVFSTNNHSSSNSSISTCISGSSSSDPYHQKTLQISQHLGNKTDRLFTFEDQTSLIKRHQETSAHGFFEQYFIKTKAYFLPNGYDSSSTNEGYGKYVSFQALAYIFGTTSSVLSMQCLLYAMGLGENALPLAATLNWVRSGTQ